ncbi:MAG: response regulator [Lentisphaerae bacterium]|nr:MAG: response regulator [Lentisphaerota bacterium]
MNQQLTEISAQRTHQPSEYTILVVDDIRDNVTMLTAHLQAKGYRTVCAYNGIEALKLAIKSPPDLIMLDVRMPQLSGLDVCAQLKQHEATKLTPIILVTAHSEPEEIVRGFEVGADDYLVKPYNYMEMLARIRSMLRIRQTQLDLLELNQRLEQLNANLEQLVQHQVEEIQRINRLRRFFSPQIVERITSEDPDFIFREHRREITVVFLDLRNFTPFAEAHSSEEVLRLIRDLHQLVGPVIFKYNGTLERFTGDGMMVFIGDPEPVEDHSEKAVMMACEIQRLVQKHRESVEKYAEIFNLGVGIARGIASLGTIGFEGRVDYAAIGAVTNRAARLCSLAKGGQILIDQPTADSISDQFEIREQGEHILKGFSRPHPVFEVLWQ